MRAIQWADAASVPLHYAVARDMASSTVLQEKPDIQRSKIEWLQRHDQECGGLYGILPICLSLPVRSADHLDRRRGILKGCKGKIVGWSIAPDAQIWNKPPEVIYVQFDTAKTWRIEGLPRDNVFPVTAQRKPWFLDRGRKCPRLRITRLQFPLAPGFAITAHVAQGQTLRDGVIADFNISSVASVFTTYVAATRVTGREKLLIMRPFPASPFQKGNGIGRELLLRVWRGDGVDWEALRAKYLEERSCSECAENKGKTAFTVGQWRRGDADRVCRECTARHRDKGEPYQCNVCRFWFSEEAFPTKYRRNESSCYRICSACEVRKPCHRCKEKKPVTEYTASAWKARNTDRRICKACMKKGHWTCATCDFSFPQMEFSAGLRHRPSGHDGTQECNRCSQFHTVRRAAARAWKRLEARRRTTRQRAIMEQVRAEIAAAVRQRTDNDANRHEPPAQPSMPRPATLDPQRVQLPHAQATEPLEFKEEKCSHGHEYLAMGVCSGTERSKKRLEYKCPYCHVTIYSTVESGNVKAAGHCGRQFRVQSGVVTRSFIHACPKCGQQIQSAKASGRIKSTHKRPDGSQNKLGHQIKPAASFDVGWSYILQKKDLFLQQYISLK